MRWWPAGLTPRGVGCQGLCCCPGCTPTGTMPGETCGVVRRKAQTALSDSPVASAVHAMARTSQDGWPRLQEHISSYGCNMGCGSFCCCPLPNTTSCGTPCKVDTECGDPLGNCSRCVGNKCTHSVRHDQQPRALIPVPAGAGSPCWLALQDVCPFEAGPRCGACAGSNQHVARQAGCAAVGAARLCSAAATCPVHTLAVHEL